MRDSQIDIARFGEPIAQVLLHLAFERRLTFRHTLCQQSNRLVDGDDRPVLTQDLKRRENDARSLRCGDRRLFDVRRVH